MISRKDVQRAKAATPLSVRAGGSVISLSDVHRAKAIPPTSGRVGGSAISLKDLDPLKVPCPAPPLESR